MKHTNSIKSQNVLVVGATGATGRRVVMELLVRGHQVTAFARRPKELDVSACGQASRLTRFQGDALNPADLDAVMPGHSAVIVVLGIRTNPLLVRFGIHGDTKADVRSRGTANVIAAMRTHGVKSLLVQTTYGIGDSEGKLPLKWRIIFSVFLKPQIADSRVQEDIVKGSGLDWTLVQPVGLTDEDTDESAAVSTDAEVPSFQVSRAAVARFFGDAIESRHYRRETVALAAA